MEKFINDYASKLITLLKNIDTQTIVDIKNTLENTLQNNNKIYILGNGGSAATASHMVNDLGVGLSRRDIKNFQVSSLADNTPVCTAIANDLGYDEIFVAQLKNKIEAKDVIIAFSCSGNSSNIIKAVEYAKKHKAIIIGISGFDGGKLKELSDINFHVETADDEYGLVEDMHMILDHIIYSYYIFTKNR